MNRLIKKPDRKSGVEVYEPVIPNVYITQEIIQKMEIIIDESSKEVGWLMEVKNEGNNYLIHEIHVPKQDVHGTTCEINSDGLTELATAMLEEEDGVDRWNSILAWGHSHVNMSAFASGQDDDQMKLFTDNGCPYYIRLIANKKGEMLVDFFDYKLGVVYTNIGWEVLEHPDVEQRLAAIDKLWAEIEYLNGEYVKEYKAHLKPILKENVKSMTTTYSNTRRGSGYWDSDLQRYVYYAELEDEKKNETNATKKTNAKDDDEWYPTDFDSLNEVFTEDEVFDIALAQTDMEQWDLIRTRCPHASGILIAKISELCDEYLNDEWDQAVQKAVTEKVAGKSVKI